MEDTKEYAVAVVTRTKNRPLLLPRARHSVEAQSFEDRLWVLVNDAGEREPVEREAAAARAEGLDTLVIHRDQSTGMEAASNDGIGRTKSKFVAIHDDDDTWHPEFLATTVAFLRDNPAYVGVTTRCSRIDETLSEAGPKTLQTTPYNDRLHAMHLGDMAVQNQFPPISFLFRRSLYEQLGGFDESLPVLGDWDFHLRGLLVGNIGVIPERLANYHLRERPEGGLQQYGNTLTDGDALHLLHDSLYRNRKLREDIEAGRPGIGFLLTMGRMEQHLSHRLDGLGHMLMAAKAVARKLKILGLMRRLSRSP
jgi:glycosyltransferase involved in cell wall biosynthesis